MFCCCCAWPSSSQKSKELQNENMKSAEFDNLQKKDVKDIDSKPSEFVSKSLDNNTYNMIPDVRAFYKKKTSLNIPISGLSSFEKFVITVPINLSDGHHIYESEKISLGNFRYYTVSAKLQFSYSYDQSENKITLDKDDTVYGKVPLRIVTYLEKDNETPFLCSNITKSEVAPNFLVQSSADVVEFKEKLDELVEKIDSCIIENLLARDIEVLETTPPPQVIAENVDDLIGICELSDEEEKQMSFDEKIVLVKHFLGSRYGGIQNVAMGTNFANVIGSTRDPRINGQSWITVWRNATGYQNPVCTTRNSYCGGRIVGGHVLIQRNAARVATGGTCYLLPICARHNGSDSQVMTVNQRNGSGGNYVRAVILTHFMQR